MGALSSFLAPPTPPPKEPSRETTCSCCVCFHSGVWGGGRAAHRIPSVVWMRVVMPTQVKIVPMSWLTMCWSRPTHSASARRKGTAMVPLKHVK